MNSGKKIGHRPGEKRVFAIFNCISNNICQTQMKFQFNTFWNWMTSYKNRVLSESSCSTFYLNDHVTESRTQKNDKMYDNNSTFKWPYTLYCITTQKWFDSILNIYLRDQRRILLKRFIFYFDKSAALDNAMDQVWNNYRQFPGKYFFYKYIYK